MNLLTGIWQDEASSRLEGGCSAFAEGGGEGAHGFLQERFISLHIAAVIRLLVEEVAEMGVDFRFAGTKDAVDVENLLRVREGEADIAIV